MKVESLAENLKHEGTNGSVTLASLAVSGRGLTLPASACPSLATLAVRRGAAVCNLPAICSLCSEPLLRRFAIHGSSPGQARKRTLCLPCGGRNTAATNPER